MSDRHPTSNMVAWRIEVDFEAHSNEDAHLMFERVLRVLDAAHLGGVLYPVPEDDDD